MKIAILALEQHKQVPIFHMKMSTQRGGGDTITENEEKGVWDSYSVTEKK